MTTSTARSIVNAVSALFVPGNRPDRFDKAVASGAHTIIIDWEDAVAPEDKKAAREATTKWFGSQRPAPHSVAIRVNAVSSEEHSADAAALASLLRNAPGSTPALVLAKTEHPHEVEVLYASVREHVEIVALIESAAGLAEVRAIAQSLRTRRLAFGAIDFALDTGMALDGDVLAYARFAMAVASRTAGIASPLDAPEIEIKNVEVAHTCALEAKRFGFTGKLCIHPAQVDPVHRAFAPSLEDIEWARTVIGSGGGAAQVDGKMVDRPIIERARQILLAEKRAF